MQKEGVVKILVGLAAFALALLMFLPVGSFAVMTDRLLLVLFFILLAAILCNGFIGALIALVVIPLGYFLFGDTFYPDQLIRLLLYPAMSLVLACFYRYYGSILGAEGVALLSGGALYGLLKIVFLAFQGVSYSLNDFAIDLFVVHWPGLLVLVFGLPLAVYYLRKANVLYVLQHEPRRR